METQKSSIYQSSSNIQTKFQSEQNPNNSAYSYDGVNGNNTQSFESQWLDYC